jgi:ribonuclease T2
MRISAFLPAARLVICTGMNLLLPASAALSQAACLLPDRIDSFDIDRPHIAQPNRLPIDSYLLALSWSPNYCATARDRPEARHQCVRNRFGWVVHGFWPNSTKARRSYDQPAYCRNVAGISEQTYRQYLCLVPGVKLMTHEWRKHGSCGFTTPENYFAKTAALHAALKLPDPLALSQTSKPFTAGKLRTAFASANPGLPLGAITVDVDRKQRLREIRICYDSRYRYASCARSGAPDRLTIGVTPVRD